MADVGRPKILLTDLPLPNDWREQIISLYSEGASDVEVRCLLRDWCTTFSQDLWDRLLEEDKEFSITIKKGRENCQQWWEKKGRKNLENKDFNYTGWYMNMKNRFKWADQQNNTHEIKDVTLNITKRIIGE
jgi:DNA-dependent RNA polymerase auxiliary subunit epsilon